MSLNHSPIRHDHYAPSQKADRIDWRNDAVCPEVDGEIFFADLSNKGETIRAKAICATCPVIAQCLEYAVDRPELVGVWGGTTTAERKKMRTNSKDGRFYTAHTRKWAVAEWRKGRSFASIARELGCADKTVSTWVGESA